MTTDDELFTDRELRQLDEAFERRDEQREVQADLLALANRQASVDYWERLMETNFEEYSRRGGSDKLLKLQQQGSE